ncbi:hypothetical protein EDD15DRAFT_2199129 [Pisolithus albus]|nr:hypothetical protein EDD15DRAFT_2199129 [Pisolithus albus]
MRQMIFAYHSATSRSYRSAIASCSYHSASRPRMAIPEPPSTFGKPGPCTTMSSGLDTPQLSTKACAGSYSHPSSSIVPETPDASISYSQQIIPAPPSSSAPRILPSNTGAPLIRGTPAAIGLFRAPKSLITLPPHTTPFPYRNYALNFAVRSPMHAQNVLVQAENASTEDEGGQAGEEEEEEERAERDEAKLVLEVARAQRKICRVEQQLSTARLEEIDALGNLYRFRAELAERKLQYADFDVGHVRHSIRKNGVSLCDLPSTRKRRRMSDNGVTGMVATFLLTFEHSRDTAIRMRSAGAKDSDDGEDETTRSSNWAEQKGWRTEGESTFLMTLLASMNAEMKRRWPDEPRAVGNRAFSLRGKTSAVNVTEEWSSMRRGG